MENDTVFLSQYDVIQISEVWDLLTKIAANETLAASARDAALNAAKALEYLNTEFIQIVYD